MQQSAMRFGLQIISSKTMRYPSIVHRSLPHQNEPGKSSSNLSSRLSGRGLPDRRGSIILILTAARFCSLNRTHTYSQRPAAVLIRISRWIRFARKGLDGTKRHLPGYLSPLFLVTFHNSSPLLHFARCLVRPVN